VIFQVMTEVLIIPCASYVHQVRIVWNPMGGRVLFCACAQCCTSCTTGRVLFCTCAQCCTSCTT